MSLTGQIAVFLAATVVAVPLFRRFKLSSVLGYLAAGMVIGPWGLGLFDDVESVLHLAEFGVVLLLFVIGLELQPSRLWVLRHSVFGAGAVQVALTTAVLAAAVMALGTAWPVALVIAFALSLSSTALVLQVLAERGELTARHGRASFAILLFQDLAIMPALVLLPLLAGQADTEVDWRAIALPVAAIAVVVVAGRFLLRPVLRIVAATRVQEAFTATALLVVVGTALLFESVGLSMALGAFIAGVLLADSEYRHELEADIEPFKGLLLGLFFIAVGMTANLDVLVERPLVIAGLTLGYLVLKALAVWAAARLTRHDQPTAWRMGVSLAGGGEFAFVLFSLAAAGGLLPRATVDLLVIVVTLSMVLSPLLIGAADRLARRLRPQSMPPAYDRIEPEEPRVLIAGFGRFGRFGRFGQIVARVLRARKIRFTALEVSQAQVDFVRRFGNKLYYGDASRLEMLRAAGAEHAQLLVLAIDDVEASVRAAEIARRHFPKLRAQAAVKDDETRLIATTQASAQQLEKLFEADNG